MRTMRTLAVLGLWAIVGCGGYEPAAPPPAAPGSQQAKAATAPKPAPAPAQPSAPTQSGMTTNMAAASAAAGIAPLDLMSGPQGVQPARPSQPAPQAKPAPQPANLEKAQAGVQKQGRGYGPGLITTPVATYFSTRARITFDIQIADAMRLYKATNGSAPKSHEEFMAKIIKENQIKLPDLPSGDRYIYVPEREELCVEHSQQ